MTALSDLVQSTNVLITGGSDGTGRGLAARYLALGATVLITGRNTQKLERTASELPDILTFANDAGKPEEREALASHIEGHLPRLNVLINNAGIQRRLAGFRYLWGNQNHYAVYNHGLARRSPPG